GPASSSPRGTSQVNVFAHPFLCSGSRKCTKPCRSARQKSSRWPKKKSSSSRERRMKGGGGDFSSPCAPLRTCGHLLLSRGPSGELHQVAYIWLMSGYFSPQTCPRISWHMRTMFLL